jgi:hypothetical protein
VKYQVRIDGIGADALGKPVLLMFSEVVGEVVGVSEGEDGTTVTFESERRFDKFQIVPSYHNGELTCFGLVPGK